MISLLVLALIAAASAALISSLARDAGATFPVPELLGLGVAFIILGWGFRVMLDGAVRL